LQMRATIAPANASTIPRIAQLTQKTNQFNLTTRRYTEADITALAASVHSAVYSLELDDCFGRNGIVGVAIVRYNREAWTIDTFLLSCRVMGRTVEKAFLSYIADTARRWGARKLIGEYYPTAKNAPVAVFYRENGFLAREESSGTLWELDLEQQTVAMPAWFELTTFEDKIHVG